MTVKAVHKLSIDEYEKYLRELQRITPAVKASFDKARKIRDEYRVVFYIAGGLTGMPDEVKNRYKAVSEQINAQDGMAMFGYAPHLHGTDPVIHPDITPGEVRDIDYLFSAVVPDYLINFWYPVAHGNAIEEAWAELAGIPDIYLVPRDFTLSRLPRGMHNIETTILYDNFQIDGLSQLRAYISNL